MLTWMLVAVFAQALPQAPTRTTTISGTVAVADGSAGEGLAVVVFPEDPSQWTGPDSAARVRRASVGNGAFVIGGLWAGSYRLAVADPGELGDWPSPALLARLRASSVPTPPMSAERITIELTVSPEAGIRRVTGVRGSISRVEMRRSGPGRGRGRAPVTPLPRPPQGTASISGRVTVDGGSARGVTVGALLWTTRNGQREPVPLGGLVTTDDAGAFEFDEPSGGRIPHRGIRRSHRPRGDARRADGQPAGRRRRRGRHACVGDDDLPSRRDVGIRCDDLQTGRWPGAIRRRVRDGPNELDPRRGQVSERGR
jgi:hypothetical protein